MGRMRGKVKFFDDRKGYGYVTSDTGNHFDYFVRRSSIRGIPGTRRTLSIGQEVEFEPFMGERSLAARDVVVIEGEEPLAMAGQ